jgi:hypothetical protein
MSTTFHQVYTQAVKFIEQGYCVIPVRDKAEETDFRRYEPKSAFRGWKKYQEKIITPSELFHQMEAHKSNWIAMIMGQVSRRIICIDIDNKHWSGVEHKLFSSIKDLYPDLWNKLRIHKTQSGGYHILFRVPEGTDIPRSKKLAWKEDEKEAGIEMRGEGSYIVVPPSAGYSVHKDTEVQEITAEEMSVIFLIIEDLNERKRVKRERETKKSKESNYYNENPFNHFNNSQQGAEIIQKYGWTFDRESKLFIHYTRKGKKGGVSASFNKEKRYYHCFTTSDDVLEGGVNYTPSFLVQTYEGFDGSQLYNWLIENGFGKANKLKEAEKAQRLAERKQPPMKNFSEEALTVYNEAVEAIKQKLPLGEYWKFGKNDEVKISRVKLYQVAQGLGFTTIDDELHRIKNEKFVEPQTIRDFQDALSDYIYADEVDLYEDICDALEKYLEKSTNYTISRLPVLDTSAILSDDQDNCYKLFQNGVLHITKKGYTLLDYKEIDQLIMANDIIDRSFPLEKKPGVFTDFIKKSVGLDDYVKQISGFLAHEWKDETTAYTVTLTEKVPDPKQGGGAGKNVFMSLFSLFTTVCSTNGSQLQYDERFFQSWNGERLMVLSDVPKSFSFTFLKEAASGSIKWRRLFKNPVDVPVERTPKIVVLTNYSYEVTDGGVRRRLIALEFSDYFTKKGGVDQVYGKHFPKGWNEDDWSDYYHFMAESIQAWMKCGKKLQNRALSDTGWIKQFTMNYGTVIRGIIEENIESWQKRVQVKATTMSDNVRKYYKDYDIQNRYQPSTKKINSALAEWCEKHGIKFQKGVTIKDGYTPCKAYIFGDREIPVQAEIDLPFPSDSNQ